MGWKDTVRMNPLEDTIVALRPIAPEVPFGLPDSVRPIDVTRPVGVSEPTISLVDGQPTTFTNALVNFGWEYVWHCHILGHEENDMMRPIKTNHVAPVVPDAPVLTVASSSGAVNLSWTDGTPATTPFGATGSSWGDPKGEMGYRIERAPITGGLGGTVGSYSALPERPREPDRLFRPDGNAGDRLQLSSHGLQPGGRFVDVECLPG